MMLEQLASIPKKKINLNIKPTGYTKLHLQWSIDINVKL